MTANLFIVSKRQTFLMYYPKVISDKQTRLAVIWVYRVHYLSQFQFPVEDSASTDTQPNRRLAIWQQVGDPSVKYRNNMATKTLSCKLPVMRKAKVCRRR